MLELESTAMHHALSEVPLAIFTAMFPIAIGAFVFICIAFWTNHFNETEVKKIDKLLIIPIALSAISFLFAVLHLKYPWHAYYIFHNIANSPLSREIAGASVTFTVVTAYWILALVKKFDYQKHKTGLVLCALAALASPIILGFAYQVPTIISWGSVGPFIYLFGNTLIGGSMLGAFVLLLALKQAAAEEIIGAGNKAAKKAAHTNRLSKNSKWAMFLLAIAGFVISIIGNIVHMNDVNNIVTAYVIGAEHFSDISLFYWVYFPLAIVALICLYVALFKEKGKLALLAWVIFLVGSFLGRLAFYGTYITVGMG
ncbi:MAG: dimethyl sulfoxide reductase anchor subunit [Coriobacteriia bacterium]|nr:dimethyl sulfoxide reductase anchor subunit [Coriobacteriia bacterium]